MGLTLHYGIEAPAAHAPERLAAFLKLVESKAQALGFAPTRVICAEFDTPQKRAFARRLGGIRLVADERLKTNQPLAEAVAWRHDQQQGTACLTPSRGVVLILTDEEGLEVSFGFLKYPGVLYTRDGACVLMLPSVSKWEMSDHLKSPDPRLRTILREFSQEGYLAFVKDDFAEEIPASA
jgi:hypothetical protein